MEQGSQHEEEGALRLPLLAQSQEEIREGSEGSAAAAAAAGGPGDIEQGQLALSEHGSDDSKGPELGSARVPGPPVWWIYFQELFQLLIFYWAITADALLLKELWSREYVLLAGLATGFTCAPHVLMSLLLIVRQGWLAAAGQACGFILTLNPFESLTPIPEGLLGLVVISVGFIAYVLIAASGLIFVGYCVVCYLVTALLFSLLILDLAALVVTACPTKGIFKYTDLVYVSNFKFSRLMLQAWLQSLPELGIICWILYTNANPDGPALEISAPILFHALAAHLVQLWDRTMNFRRAVRVTGSSHLRHLVLVLAMKGGVAVSRPVFTENFTRVMRGDATFHFCGHEDADDMNDDAAASMVPEYLTPSNGGVLSPGQVCVVLRAALVRFSSARVTTFVLDIAEGPVGKLLVEACAAFPNLRSVRISNARVWPGDAPLIAQALLGCHGLQEVTLQQVKLGKAAAQALAGLLEGTPSLKQLDLIRCPLHGNAYRHLAAGLRHNRTLRQLQLSGTNLKEAGQVALCNALAGHKTLEQVNLAFCALKPAAVECLAEALVHSASLRCLAVSQPELSPRSAAQLVAAVSAWHPPKQPPGLDCHLGLGTFGVTHLEQVKYVCVQDQDGLTLDAWQDLVSDSTTPGDAPPSDTTGAAASSSSTAAAAAAAAGDRGLSDAANRSLDGIARSLDSTAATLTSAGHPLTLDGVVSPAGAPPAPRPLFSGAFLNSSAGGSSGSRGAGLGASESVAAAAAAGGSGGVGDASPQHSLPSMTAAVFFSGARHHPASSISSTRHPAGVYGDASGSSSSRGAGTAALGAFGSGSSSPSSTTPPRPVLCFVVLQANVVQAMVQTPLVIPGLTSLDLSGLGIKDEGATEMGKVLKTNPGLRRLVLADNGIGQEGAAALSEALQQNSALQVLDLSCNEFDDAALGTVAAAARTAAGLTSLVLLGNKTPFSLATLRALQQAEAENPRVHLVLVEEPQEVVERLTRQGHSLLAARAATFYQQQVALRATRAATRATRATAASKSGAAAQQRQQQQQQQQRDASQQQQRDMSPQQPQQQREPLPQQQQQQQQQGEAEEAPDQELQEVLVGEHSGSSSGGSSGREDGGPGGAAAPASTRGSASPLSPPPAATIATAAGGGGAGGGVLPAGQGVDGQGLSEVPPIQAVRVSTPPIPSTSAAAAAAAGAVSPVVPGGVPPESPLSCRSTSCSLAAASVAGSSTGEEEELCGVCLDNHQHVAIKYCGHRLCVDCYRKVWELGEGTSNCPFCRARLEGYVYLDWPLE